MIYQVKLFLSIAIFLIGLVGLAALISLMFKKKEKDTKKARIENETKKDDRNETMQLGIDELSTPMNWGSLSKTTNAENAINLELSEKLSNGFPLGQNEMPSTDDSEIKEPSHKIEDYNNLPGEKDTQLIYEAQEKRKKVEPEHRGGKYVGTESNAPAYIEKTECAKCNENGCLISLICIKKSIGWKLEVELEILEGQNCIISVMQNTTELEVSDESDACYTLANAYSNICIILESNGIEKSKNLTMPSFPMLFRIESKNKAIHTTSASKGEYLCLIPDNWSKPLAGCAAISPEQTTIPHIIAYYFYLDDEDSNSISFSNPEGRVININSRKKGRFVLEGNRLTYSRKTGVEYFVDSFPKICYRNKSVANMATLVGTLVFGMNEGSKFDRKRYSKKYSRDCDSLYCLSLQDIFNEGKESASKKPPSGRYYVRIYDHEDILIESFAFYFLAEYFEIKIDNEDILPTVDGHRSVTISFCHDSNYNIANDNNLENISIIERTEKTIVFKLKPRCGIEELNFKIEIDGYSFKLPLYIPRLWWTIHQNNELNIIWQDRAINLARRDCSASSETSIIIYIPEMLYDIDIFIGFDAKNKKVYKRKKSENSIEINMRDFSDHPYLSIPGVHDLKLWVKEKQRYTSVTFCKITVLLICSICGFSSTEEIEMKQHYSNNHICDDFESLTYEELRALQPDLPARIIQCIYCGYYIAETIEQHETTEMCHHIEKSCPMVNHDSLEPSKKCFRSITNPEEIKQHVIENLELHRKCKQCNEIIDDENEFMNHIMKKHGKKKMYKLG
ncbi:MAG TPA: hypothetical protein PLX63_06055 [Rectinema sp.]|jgi:hypothetical protein|nr:hypothetical protein [Spirochaetaceae bacterium]HOM92988.1 hypothetical protein [Rectinema sp.]HQK09595.1 hypothetical protein [Rectinema sp.]HRT38696.1 hypothetical protein [Rectinema sp.]